MWTSNYPKELPLEKRDNLQNKIVFKIVSFLLHFPPSFIYKLVYITFEISLISSLKGPIMFCMLNVTSISIYKILCSYSQHSRTSHLLSEGVGGRSGGSTKTTHGVKGGARKNCTCKVINENSFTLPLGFRGLTKLLGDGGCLWILIEKPRHFD